MVSHIRRANRGGVSLENTHPFTRELWGRAWTFAHNGQLRGVKRWPLGIHRPIGTTDSEHAFCWMLAQLRGRWPTPPGDATLSAHVAALAAQLSRLGVFNMLMSDGRQLFCFCGTKLAWITRRAPFGPATLVDEDLTADFSQLTTPGDIVSVIATRPLTRDETWTTMGRGEFVVFRGGMPGAGGGKNDAACIRENPRRQCRAASVRLIQRRCCTRAALPLKRLAAQAMRGRAPPRGGVTSRTNRRVSK